MALFWFDAKAGIAFKEGNAEVFFEKNTNKLDV